MPADGDTSARPPRGVRVGVDLGDVRIGVAASDPDGLVATPVETVRRTPDDASADLARLVSLVAERDAVVVYVGLPRHLSGSEGSSSAAVRTYSGALARAVLPVPVRLVDERLSTVTAHQALRASGRSGRRHRPVVDQAAAVVILQAALEAERTAGDRVGEVVAPQGDGTTEEQGMQRTTGDPRTSAGTDGPSSRSERPRREGGS